VVSARSTGVSTALATRPDRMPVQAIAGVTTIAAIHTALAPMMPTRQGMAFSSRHPPVIHAVRLSDAGLCPVS
jgi:hypothetical protein